MKMLRFQATATLVVGFVLSTYASLAAPAVPPQERPKTSAANAAPAAEQQLSPEEKQRRKDWALSMHKKSAPRKGCFTVAYPSTEWKEVTCVKAPNIPSIPRHGPRPAVVGNGNDVSAQAPSGHISQAIGRFENVTNVTSESGPIANAGPSIANTYTLQINSDQPNTGTCPGTPAAGCTPWEQWIFWNTPGTTSTASTQYWLIGYGPTCPTGQGWIQYGNSCYKNSTNAVQVMPNQSITNMANWILSGTATATGDSITMTSGTAGGTTNGDNVVAASTFWTIAEFNMFGYGADNSGNGGTASLNAGASSNARTEIIYGDNKPPNCSARGFTAEMNNLSFGPTAPAATQPGPAVIFSESIAGGATSDCAAATTVGDTHLHTFNGLFYDFQASGDFTLAEVGRDFSVQTRQVSGAPTWPNATVNKAVAGRFGKTQVAICLAPSERDERAAIYVNGTLTPVGDGQTLGLPGDVGIARQGNVYQLTSEEGNSVRATVNPTWIDVVVGLGQWPSPVRGLIANPNGNLNQIEARDGFVLTNPFNFNDLYHRFADSWRVSGEASMLSVCSGGKPAEVGIPERTFYAKDLEPGLREKAQGVCTTAGVKQGPLFEACTLDVAVIGNDLAAKVFVEQLPPAAVGTITGGGGGILAKWWWLFLLLLLLIILLLWFLLRKKP